MKSLLACICLAVVTMMLSGCYYDPGYGYVRSNGSGGAYYGAAAPVYQGGYYDQGGYYGTVPTYYGGYGGGYYGCCYTSGVTVGIGGGWYGRPYYRGQYRQGRGYDHGRHADYRHQAGQWRGDGRYQRGRQPFASGAERSGRGRPTSSGQRGATSGARYHGSHGSRGRDH